MADNDLDYHIDEDLEQLFHSDLQNLELGHEEKSQDDVIGDHLPEWLIGVIIVIIMLILAFFVMIITSLIKNRQKNRSTYTGTATGSACDDLESGKIGHSDDPGMKMTSFSSVSDTLHDDSLHSHPTHSEHERLNSSTSGSEGILGVQGCRNPLFVDDEPDDDQHIDENADKISEIKNTTRMDDIDIYAPSTSNGYRGGEVVDHGKSKGMAHKYKQSSSAKKSISGTRHAEDQVSENESDNRKRMFASKSKSGSHGAGKRERSKGVDLNDSASSPDTDDQKREKAEETNKGADNNNRSRGSTHKTSKASDKDACCEDSGVELGCGELPSKEEGSDDGRKVDDAGCSITIQPLNNPAEEKEINISINNEKDEVNISLNNSSPDINIYRESSGIDTVNEPTVTEFVHNSELANGDDSPVDHNEEHADITESQLDSSQRPSLLLGEPTSPLLEKGETYRNGETLDMTTSTEALSTDNEDNADEEDVVDELNFKDSSSAQSGKHLNTTCKENFQDCDLLTTSATPPPSPLTLHGRVSLSSLSSNDLRETTSDSAKVFSTNL